MNKPVAWMSKEDFENKNKEIWTLFKVRYEKKYDYTVPLYTHPPAQQWTIEAKFKELTNEEIDEVYAEYRAKGYKTFARAILRKAQEK